MHKIVHASGTAWHHCAGPACTLVSSVTADMEPLPHAMQQQASLGGDAAALSPRLRFLTLASMAATLATVMLHHPSSHTALSALVMQRQLACLLTFCDSLLPTPAPSARQVGDADCGNKGRAPAAISDPALPSCMQFISAWLALMHKVTPLQVLAGSLEAPCSCQALAAQLSQELPSSWQRVRAPPAATATADGATATQASAQPATDDVSAVVSSLVQGALAQALQQHGETLAPMTPDSFGGAGVQQEHKQDSQLTHASASGRLPLWLSVIGLAGMFTPAQLLPLQASAGDAGRPVASRPQAAAWAVIATLAPALPAIAPFCTHVHARAPSAAAAAGGEASEAPWASLAWQHLAQQTGAVMQLAAADAPELSRALAAYLVAMLTHQQGQAAVQQACVALRGFVAEAALPDSDPAARATALETSTAAADTRHRFLIQFATSLLGTSVRRQGTAAATRVQLAQHVVELAAGSSAGTDGAMVASSTTPLHSSLLLAPTLPLQDRLQLSSVVLTAAQRAHAAGKGNVPADLAAKAVQAFAALGTLLVQQLTDLCTAAKARPVVSKERSDDATAAPLAPLDVDSADAAEARLLHAQRKAAALQVQQLAGMMHQLAQLVPGYGAAVVGCQLHIADLLTVAACLLGSSTGAAGSIDLNPSFSGPTPGQAPDTKPVGVESALEAGEAESILLATAADCLRGTVHAALAHSMVTGVRIATLCSTASALPGNAAASFQSVYNAIAASTAVGSGSRSAADASCTKLQAAASAAVDTMRRDLCRRRPAPQLPLHTAVTLLRDLQVALSADQSDGKIKVKQAEGTLAASLLYLSMQYTSDCKQILHLHLSMQYPLHCGPGQFMVSTSYLADLEWAKSVAPLCRRHSRRCKAVRQLASSCQCNGSAPESHRAAICSPRRHHTRRGSCTR